MDVLQLGGLGNQAEQLGHAIKGRCLHNAYLHVQARATIVGMQKLKELASERQKSTG